MNGLWATRPWQCPICTYIHDSEREAQFLSCKECFSERRLPELDHRVAAQPMGAGPELDDRVAAQPQPASPDGARALPVKPEPMAAGAPARAPVDDALMA